MLFTNLFNFQDSFIQKINYHSCLAAADSQIAPLSRQEAQKIYLSTCFWVKLCDKKTVDTFFPRKSGQVLLSYINNRAMDPKILEKKLVGATVLVYLYHNFSIEAKRVSFTPIIKTYRNSLYIYINKQDWSKIDPSTLNYQINDALSIQIVSLNNVVIIPLLSLVFGGNDMIKISRPDTQINLPYLREAIKKYLYFVRDSYNGFLFSFFDGKMKKNIKTKQMVIHNKKDSAFNLHFDENPPIFLYDRSYIPHWGFFNEFFITLHVKEDTSSNEKLVAHFQKRPSTHMEVLQTKRSNTTFNLQITKYNKQKPKSEESWATKSYMNFDFKNGECNFLNKGIDMFIYTNETNAGIEINLKFYKKYDNKGFELKDNFENSITLIAMSTLDDNNQPVFLHIHNMSKENTKDSFKLKSTIPKISKDKESNFIYQLLINKKGFLSIQVQQSSEVIIDYKIFFSEQYMHVLSSNKIREYVGKSWILNDVQGKKGPKNMTAHEIHNDDMNPGSYKQSLHHTSYPFANYSLNENTDGNPQLTLDTSGNDETLKQGDTVTGNNASERINPHQRVNSVDSSGNDKNNSKKTIIIVVVVGGGVIVIGGVIAYIFLL